MNYLFKIQKKLVPELINIAEIRYNILKEVFNHQPIGRRNLARRLKLSIRNVRKHLDFLYDKRYIRITQSGAFLTENGEDFLHELDSYIKEVRDLTNIEKEIEDYLDLDQVMVVPVEKNSEIINKEIGRFTSRYLKEMIKDGDIIAVTGGSTLARVAESMVFLEDPKDVTVIPGRGGLGENVEIQANTIASKIAKKLGGSYRLLHIPDDITKRSLAMINEEPSIKKTLDQLHQANILIHGIGTAEMMSSRRDMPESEIRKLKEKGAIAEAFGLYFNEDGEVVYSTASVGLSMEDLKNIDKVIAVAGGVDKARAIVSIVSPEYHDILITDEITALEIISLKGGENKRKS